MRQHASQYQPRPLFAAPIHTIINLDRSSGLPLYRQICQRLREAILSGELSEGTRLPTERALATELGVNRTTVMNAYNELASEGLIEGHVGRGTLVRRNQFGFLGDVRVHPAGERFGHRRPSVGVEHPERHLDIGLVAGAAAETDGREVHPQ